MSIILNERDVAREAIETRRLGNNTVETLALVAKYLRQENGYSKREVRTKLGELLLQCDPRANLVSWSDMLDSLTKQSDKHPLKCVDEICVTNNELDLIGGIDGVQLQRLAFTLLCVSKFWDIINQNNNGWVNASDKEIMEMANIRTSVQRQSAMYNKLWRLGLIGYSKRVDNLNIQVLFTDNGGEVELHISDFRNLGNQYMMYRGMPYIRCAQCGLAVKKTGNRQKYCPSCAAEAYVQQSVESVTRGRAASRTA